MAQTITIIGPAGCDTVEIYSTAEGSRTTKIAERTMEVGEISGTLYQPVDWELSSSPVTLSNARYRVLLKAGTVEALTDFVTITASSGDFESEGYAAAADVDLSTVEDRLGYTLAALAGDCADAGTAAETYTITLGVDTYTIDHTGLDATGNRGTATLTKNP